MSRLISRVASFAARHRLAVLAAWLVIFASASVLTGIASAGGDNLSTTTSMPDTAASRALEKMHHEYPGTIKRADSLQLVFQASHGAVTDPLVATEIDDTLQDARAIAHVSAVTDPLEPAHPFISSDKTTAVATITFDRLTDTQKDAATAHVESIAERASTDMEVLVGGALREAQQPPFGPGEIVGILVAFLVLLITFGSLVSAGANMLVALSGVVVGTVGILAYSFFNPIGETTLTLANMLGLAVGIDYSLFIITRFRAELRSGRTVQVAIERAAGTAGTSVVFAGLTVIIALLGLSVVHIGFITEMGVAGAAGVLIAVLMSLTLLPVLLATIGRRALSRRERLAVPATPRAARRRGFSYYWAGFTIKRPKLAIVSGVAVLAVIALPMLSMRTASNVPGGEDPSSQQRAAYNLVVDQFGGIQSPLVVLAEGNGIASQLPAIDTELSGLDHVQNVLPGPVNSAGNVAMISVVPAGGPIDDGTKQLVSDIRAQSKTLAGAKLEVTGETAIGIDSDEALHTALLQYLLLIVGLSILLLILLFRSLLMPLIATFGYLLSVGASFGASVAVFQWGWLDALIPAPQGDPMLSVLPIILVGILFGLAMDYQVFVGSRIKELHDKGMSPTEAICAGFRTSAPVVVAAAFIMAFVFGGFATSPMTVAASIAFGLMVGVLADALLVRMLIVPALLAVLGEAAWWMPRWLDRMLPTIDTEGAAYGHGTGDRTRNARQPARQPSSSLS